MVWICCSLLVSTVSGKSNDVRQWGAKTRAQSENNVPIEADKGPPKTK